MPRSPKGRQEGVAQVIVKLDASKMPEGACPVGRAAYVEFPDVGLIDVMRARTAPVKFLEQTARVPTKEERAKERSILLSGIADVGVIFLQIVFAAITGSLTLFSEAVRSILMQLVEFYSLWLLSAVHRDRLKHFKFGIGKVEQFVWLLIGFGLFLSGLWWWRVKVVESVFATQIAPTPLGLAFAAMVNAVNLLINALSFYAMFTASRGDDSDIFRAQLKSRGVKLGNSVFLQITLTVGALSSDPVVAPGA